MVNPTAGLTPGDKAPNIEFPGPDQVARNLYNEFCALPVAILVCESWPDWPLPDVSSRTALIIVAGSSGSNPDQLDESPEQLFWLNSRSDIVSELSPSGEPVLIGLDANHVVVSTLAVTSAKQLSSALADLLLQTRPPEHSSAISSSMPALVVRAALEPAFCRELINHHETQDAETSGVYRMIGGKSVYVSDKDTKVRTECRIDGGALLRDLEARMQRRVLPEIYKCFQFPVTRYEGFKVVCYDADEGGHFVAHRDNDGPDTAHRRFALTVNLNTEDYEGGGLRFPEYSADHFAPATGDAIVFSCSVAHEVLRLKRGRRFALISFFYGDNDQLRKADFAR